MGDFTLAIEFPKEDGSRPSVERLVDLHRQLVFRTAYRLLGRAEDAQDACQEVFLRLVKNQDAIEGSASAWLYRVTVNVCRDFYRRRLQAVEVPDRADPSPGPDFALAMEERKRLLMEGLQTLPERERAAVVLRDIEGLSTREVAAVLGVEEVTIRSQISMARVKLAKFVRNKK